MVVLLFMENMKQFVEKKYDLDIDIYKRFLFFVYRKTIKLSFWKAKLIEFIEYELLKDKEDIIFFFIKFIRKYGLNIKKSDEPYLLDKFTIIFETIKDTFLKYEMEFSYQREDDIEPPYSSMIATLSKELSVSPRDLLYNYNIEETFYLLEGVIWNGNSSTERWKEKNKIAFQKKKAKNYIKENKKDLDEFFKD